jgi:hypothetical protein
MAVPGTIVGARPEPAAGVISMRFVRSAPCIPLAIAAAVACDGSSTGPEGPVPNFVRLESDAGDWVGAGGSYEYTQADAIISVTADGGHLAISVQGNEQWSANFVVPSTLERLEPGSYEDLQRYPFHDPEAGGLSWSGEGRGCNTLTGSFTIDRVTYETDGTLAAIDLRFVQHCEGGSSALRGTVHWRADDPTEPPGPVSTIPSNLWRPAAGATPASGDYVYLKSDAGDYIGQGATHTYTPASATIGVSADGGLLSVSVEGGEWWYGDFETMITLDRLEQGYYPDLERWPFHNPLKGGLSWWGQGRGCNTLRGWFVVDYVSYAGNELTGIDLRFQQRCEGGSSALYGAIRWRA